MKFRFTLICFLVCVVSVSLAQKSGSGNFADNSILSSGQWYKIGTIIQGVHCLTYADIVQMGVSGPLSSADFRLFGNGGAMLPESNAAFRYDDLAENPVMVDDGGDGYLNEGDRILFYGQNTVSWSYNSAFQRFDRTINLYADTVYYFFTFDHGPGKRIQTYPQISLPADTIISTFDEHLYHERDSVNLLRSGKQWYGEVFNDLETKTFNFIMTDVSPSDPLSIRINMAVSSIQKSVVTSAVDGVVHSSDTILPIDGNVNSDYAKPKTISLSVFPQEDTVVVSISYNKPQTSSVAWLNCIDLSGVRNLIYRGGQLNFRNVATSGQAVSRFDVTTTAVIPEIWNITDFMEISAMPVAVNGTVCSVTAYTDSLLEFVAFDDSDLLHPILLGATANQNLHGLSQAELVAVTHPDFLNQANTLADFHRATDGMMVAVATTEQIYNEFSSGKPDPAAIRDFLRMFYERGQSDSVHRIKYVLLMGDGSYDMKNRLKANTNFVPSWQTNNSLVPTSSYVSDDFFTMLDPQEGENLVGNLDIGAGRFPVTTSQEAAVVVEKCIRYGTREDFIPDSYETGTVSNFDPWRNVITFIADDEDINLHLKQAEKLVTLVDSITKNYNINKIYLDAYKQINTPFGTKYPEVNEAIDKQVAKGTLMINYTGHGGETGLASENVLTMDEIEQYTNYYNLPIFVTATCEFSRYDNPAFLSAGEKLLLSQKGGSIALFSTTRVAYAHSNEIVNRNLLKTAFIPVSGDRVRFGDMIRKAKNLCAAGVYMQNFTLLGDPALAFAVPEYQVITDFCGIDTASANDTLFNNSVVTVRGHIADADSVWQPDFNGKLFPLVFDKPVLCQTLANDPGASQVRDFYIQQNEIYRGNVTVTNGTFEFSFFVPRDISFSDGFGKISYYAKSLNHDAVGVLDSLKLFNDGNNESDDITGPAIDAFMETLSFVDGDKTSSQPLMLLHLWDTSGINSYNIGIGHEITAVLDDDFNNPICLNDYFLQEADNYAAGSITYRFNTLAYGAHKIIVKAFDLLNNSSETEIHFYVEPPADAGFGKVYNYPDPFYDYTTFYIEHNMSLAEMQVKIHVFDITGRLSAEIDFEIPAGQYLPTEWRWNGCNQHGEPLSKGLYSYTVTLTDNNGKQKRCSDKLIILK